MGKENKYEGCYTRSQWDWLYKKYMEEGYSITGIARFLNMHRNSILYHLKKRGPTKRPDLETFRAEFEALGDQEGGC